MMVYLGVLGNYEGWYVQRKSANAFQGVSRMTELSGVILATAEISGARYRLVEFSQVPNTSFPERLPLWFAEELFVTVTDNADVAHLNLTI